MQMKKIKPDVPIILCSGTVPEILLRYGFRVTVAASVSEAIDEIGSRDLIYCFVT